MKRSSKSYGRRAWLKFVGAGILLAGAAAVRWFTWNREDETDAEPTLAPAAPYVPLPGERDYLEFLSNIQLNHITPAEIVRTHDRERNGVRNSLPPREMWNAIVPTLKLADAMRAELGVPVYLVSAYRSPEYNAECPGAAKFSQHKKNTALDLKFDCPSTEAFECIRRMRDEGRFLGGIGFYSTFVHVDTRGNNATWGV